MAGPEDIADLGIKVDANDQFVGLRGKMDQSAAAQQHVVDLLTRRIDEHDGRYPRVQADAQRARRPDHGRTTRPARRR